jgi:hypothetical protein
MKAGLKRSAHKWIRLPAIQAVNVALLAILLVGVPAVTGISLGQVRVSSVKWLERLVMGGLALGVAANAAARWASSHRKERSVFLGWMILHGSLLGTGLLAHFGWIDFGWLKDWLGRMASWLKTTA